MVYFYRFPSAYIQALVPSIILPSFPNSIDDIIFSLTQFSMEKAKTTKWPFSGFNCWIDRYIEWTWRRIVSRVSGEARKIDIAILFSIKIVIVGAMTVHWKNFLVCWGARIWKHWLKLHCESTDRYMCFLIYLHTEKRNRIKSGVGRKFPRGISITWIHVSCGSQKIFCFHL